MSLLVTLERLDRSYYAGAPVALGVLGSLSAYYVAFSYGAGVTGLVLGKERAVYILGNVSRSPLLVLVGIPLIPVVLVAVEAYDLEGRILVLWRSSISQWVKSTRLVGSVVEWLWPSPTREPHISTQEGLTGSVDYFTRCLSAGLLFPFFAYTVGLLFRPFIQSHTRRTVLGGVLFFSLKTLLKVYLRQQEYRRQGSRRVMDYIPPQPQDS